MDLSLLANIAQITTFTATIGLCIWKTFLWVKTRIANAKSAATEGRMLAQFLLDKSTTAERRADIHSFIHIKEIEVQGRRTRAAIFYATISAVYLQIIIWGIYLYRISETWPLYLIVLSIVSLVLLVISAILLAISETIILNLENGWKNGVENAIHTRIEKHISYANKT